MTVEASERLTSEGGSQLTLHKIGMRLYMKPDLDGSNYPNESSEAIQPNHKKIDCQQSICNLSLAQWGIKRVQRQKCTYRVGEIHRNVNMATLPHLKSTMRNT